MDVDHRGFRWLLMGLMVVAAAVFSAGCAPDSSAVSSPPAEEMLTLPELQPVDLGGERLRVVATTSIIGDVVSQVGGEAIAMTTLMGPGQDPHSFQPAPQDLIPVAEADVIFVNGWDLEEALIDDLAQISQGVPMVPISANIEPLPFADGHGDGEEEHEAGHTVDPHTWFAVENVKQWVENTVAVLSALDEENAETYRRNGAAYLAELDELEAYSQAALAPVGEEERKLVTNHDSLGYFADAYGFTVLNSVIPAASTLAEPSAGELAALIRQMEENDVCTLVTETTASESLARTVADELDHCQNVHVLQLYTGAVGAAGSGADSYMGMFRANIDTLAEALR